MFILNFLLGQATVAQHRICCAASSKQPVLGRVDFYIAAVRRVQCHTGLTYHLAKMSKIKNGGLDQYGKVLSLNGIGGEWVKNY